MQPSSRGAFSARNTALPLLLLCIAWAASGVNAHTHRHDRWHGTADDHLRSAHGVYRPPSPDGINPFPLVEPDFLVSEPQLDLQTPSGDSIYSGLGTFAHLPYGACLSSVTAQIPVSDELAPGDTFDVAVLGMPFDTAVSYRPGARFGPSGIRHNSKRMSRFRGCNVPLDVDIYRSEQKVIDCGDVPVTAFDNNLAIRQMEEGYSALLQRNTTAATTDTGVADAEALYTRTGRPHPKIVTLGGDHTLVLPVLRALNRVYGPVAVVHFDAHLDSWNPGVYGDESEARAGTVNHGTFFWHASNEGLVRNETSMHAGIRTRLARPTDYDEDRACGFSLLEAGVIDEIGAGGIVERIRAQVEGNPIYLSIDIDVLDPSAAPATGTPETGGWTSRELRRIVRGLEGLDIVGADVVEVAPPYDTQAALTQVVAADLVWEVLGLVIKRGPLLATGKE